MENISATIITYNEASRISACLESLRIGILVDEIIVVDSGSTDDTAEICRHAGCRVVVRPFLGYGAQRQYATSLTNNNYILSIDADECLSDELANAILKIKQQGFDHRVYQMKNHEYVMDKRVHIPGGAKFPIRLFNKRYAQWNLEDVAERVTFPSSLQPQMLEGHLMHRRAETIKELYDKELHQAVITAAIYQKQNKITYFTPGYKAIRHFFWHYLGNRGFLDGATGLKIAMVKARAVKTAYTTMRQKTK